MRIGSEAKNNEFQHQEQCDEAADGSEDHNQDGAVIGTIHLLHVLHAAIHFFHFIVVFLLDFGELSPPARGSFPRKHRNRGNGR